MNTSDFDFDLPPELIAQSPLPDRSASRMMVVHCVEGRIEHRRVTDLPDYLRAGDLMVVNDTRVIPARIFGRRTDTGGRIELLLVEQTAPDEWECMCRASGRPGAGTVFDLADGQVRGEVSGRTPEGRFRVRFQTARPLLEVLEEHGVPPVPPYIKRSPGDNELVRLDRARYQTVFAREPGAVAAPTAGLHFTEALMTEIERHGVGRATVTLHVGPGTFKPVKAERLEDHVMESERYEVGSAAAEAICAARARGGRVLAVGSTTVRTLEAVAREKDRVTAHCGRSSLFIYPPFDFRATDLMLTNFHLPKSTLLMMVCALADWRRRTAVGSSGGGGANLIRRAYAEAVQNGYRFYSYGDCMLLL